MGEILQVAAAALVADRQSSGWFARMNSKTGLVGIVDDGRRGAHGHAFRHGVLQAVWSFGIFSTSTKHIRQLASGFSLGW
ncbi:MAG: hypothetical protein U0361_13240 [Nitrospiraceae bacterium]